ncbi:MAG TPA: cyclic peptide export ABC transporter [Pyrinomonadaceae bacterium]|jgi:putative ATP-binding cassette transporter|nr:cyclic peptide export ABC transporter [Pyrinomonadaceae bacterium]
MKIIYFMMQYSRRLLVLAVLAGIISGAANTALLADINAALNNTQHQKSTLALIFIGLCLLVPLTRIVAELLLAHLGQGALYKLRMDLSRQILGVPLRRLEELGAPKLMAALTDDVPNITNIVTVIPILCINIAVAISCLVYMAFLSWPLFLAVLAIIVIGIVSYQLPVAKSFQYMTLARREGDNLFTHFRALTEGIKELKVHADRRKAFLTENLQTTAGNFRRHNISALTIYTIASSWGQMLVFVVIGLLLFVLASWFNITSTVMTGFTLTILYLMTPLQVVMNTLPNMGRANVALNNVEELGLSLVSSPTEEDSQKLLGTGASWESLELSGVTHSYQREGEESLFILGPINLSMRPGELIFLTGGNGSGKTTLAKLLIGLYTPESGEIRLDGQPIEDEMTDYYRQHFSVVFSDYFLFETLLGLHADQLDARAHEYLRQLQLDHKVKVTDGTFSTTELSQGQRKRLALLTAYLEDRPIYLFDEWAADQDPHFKEIFYYQILPDLKARGKTVIAITHDDRYYHVGDRIIKLDSGQIVYDRSVADPISELEELPVAVR